FRSLHLDLGQGGAGAFGGVKLVYAALALAVDPVADAVDDENLGVPVALDPDARRRRLQRDRAGRGGGALPRDIGRRDPEAVALVAEGGVGHANGLGRRGVAAVLLDQLRAGLLIASQIPPRQGHRLLKTTTSPPGRPPSRLTTASGHQRGMGPTPPGLPPPRESGPPSRRRTVGS